MNLTALDLAERYLGLSEVPGSQHNNFIAALVELMRAEAIGGDVSYVGQSPADDETPWCSAWMGWLGFCFDLPRPSTSGSAKIRTLCLRARAWLTIGAPITFHEARAGWDFVVFNRAGGPPEPTVLNAAGHVGLYLRQDGPNIWVRGGNQGNKVSDAPYPAAQVLGVRRWYHDGALPETRSV